MICSFQFSVLLLHAEQLLNFLKRDLSGTPLPAIKGSISPPVPSLFATIQPLHKSASSWTLIPASFPLKHRAGKSKDSTTYSIQLFQLRKKNFKKLSVNRSILKLSLHIYIFVTNISTFFMIPLLYIVDAVRSVFCNWCAIFFMCRCIYGLKITCLMSSVLSRVIHRLLIRSCNCRKAMASQLTLGHYNCDCRKSSEK